MASLVSRPEQLGSVQGALSTYLEFFINPEIAEVFCANEPTFSLGEIDAGKFVAGNRHTARVPVRVALHQHGPELSYYFHALSRFDKPAAEREKLNLIVLFADEGQEIPRAAR